MNATCEIAAERLNEQNGDQTERTNQQGNCGYKRILVGADLSEDSPLIVKHALQLAKQNNAELLLLHAQEIERAVSFIPAGAYEDWQKSVQNQIMSQVRSLVEQAHKAGIRCHVLILAGLPENVIAYVAKRLKIDLVVIGTHGHRRLARFLFGSLASRITSRVRCPTLTLHEAA